MPGSWANRPPAHTRGYDHAHRTLRAAWAPHVEAGEVDCARCGKRIDPGTAWELGHDDADRTKYNGPEHRGCNQAAGSKLGNARRPREKRANEPHPGLIGPKPKG